MYENIKKTYLFQVACPDMYQNISSTDDFKEVGDNGSTHLKLSRWIK